MPEKCFFAFSMDQVKCSYIEILLLRRKAFFKQSLFAFSMDQVKCSYIGILLLRRKAFFKPFRDDLVVGVECMFAWYWLADLCSREGIEFILGHALFMKAVHGGKAKNDKIDSHKIAVLLRGGSFPVAYVYPPEMRATRDLLRRRNYLVHKRAELLAHIQCTAIQYNLPAIAVDLTYKGNRKEVDQHFPDPQVRKIVQVDLAMIDAYDDVLKVLELDIEKTAKRQDWHALMLLRSIRGVGQIYPWRRSHPRSGNALRNPRHRAFSDSPGLRLVLPASEVHSRIEQ